jgi:FMN reductase
MQVSVVVGNPNAGGRTTRVAETTARYAIEAIGATAQTTVDVIELAHVASRLFAWEDAELAALNQKVAASNLVITACPVYKASYTGLLKAFLDRYGNNGMAGTVALPVMLGAAPHHALAVETHLRPLLVELGASVPTRGLYLLESQMDELDAVISGFMATAGPILARVFGR